MQWLALHLFVFSLIYFLTLNYWGEKTSHIIFSGEFAHSYCVWVASQIALQHHQHLQRLICNMWIVCNSVYVNVRSWLSLFGPVRNWSFVLSEESLQTPGSWAQEESPTERDWIEWKVPRCSLLFFPKVRLTVLFPLAATPTAADHWWHLKQ